MKRVVLVALALVAGGAQAAGAQSSGARLQGTFAMVGVVTRAVDVYGEHRGQRVHRSWTFVPQCATGSCARVLLERQRSGRRIRDTLMLTRQGSGQYAGRGHFSVALRCAGRVVRAGGLATERITVRITATTTVGTTSYATGITANYQNPKRINRTRCPGGIGHDAARYHGRLSTPLP